METCQHDGCTSGAISCYLMDTDRDGLPDELLCSAHAAEAGYCMVCGDFWGGIESFDFLHPGVCDNCHDELEANDADFNDDWDMEDVDSADAG